MTSLINGLIRSTLLNFECLFSSCPSATYFYFLVLVEFKNIFYMIYILLNLRLLLVSTILCPADTNWAHNSLNLALYNYQVNVINRYPQHFSDCLIDLSTTEAEGWDSELYICKGLNLDEMARVSCILNPLLDLYIKEKLRHWYITNTGHD